MGKGCLRSCEALRGLAASQRWVLGSGPEAAAPRPEAFALGQRGRGSQVGAAPALLADCQGQVLSGSPGLVCLGFLAPGFAEMAGEEGGESVQLSAYLVRKCPHRHTQNNV